MSYYQQSQPAVAAQDPGRTLGLVGLILSIVGLFVPLVGLAGLIVSIVGLTKSKAAGCKNGLALAGIVVFAVSVVLVLILLGTGVYSAILSGQTG